MILLYECQSLYKSHLMNARLTDVIDIIIFRTPTWKFCEVEEFKESAGNSTELRVRESQWIALHCCCLMK